MRITNIGKQGQPAKNNCVQKQAPLNSINNTNNINSINSKDKNSKDMKDQKHPNLADKIELKIEPKIHEIYKTKKIKKQKG